LFGAQRFANLHRQRLQMGLKHLSIFRNDAHGGQFGFRWFAGLGFRNCLGVRSCSSQSQAKKDNRSQPTVPAAFHVFYNTDEA
jgi:hypothetical protein